MPKKARASIVDVTISEYCQNINNYVKKFSRYTNMMNVFCNSNVKHLLQLKRQYVRNYIKKTNVKFTREYGLFRNTMDKYFSSQKTTRHMNYGILVYKLAKIVDSECYYTKVIYNLLLARQYKPENTMKSIKETENIYITYSPHHSFMTTLDVSKYILKTWMKINSSNIYANTWPVIIVKKLMDAIVLDNKWKILRMYKHNKIVQQAVHITLQDYNLFNNIKHATCNNLCNSLNCYPY